MSSLGGSSETLAFHGLVNQPDTVISGRARTQQIHREFFRIIFQKPSTEHRANSNEKTEFTPTTEDSRQDAGRTARIDSRVSALHNQLRITGVCGFQNASSNRRGAGTRLRIERTLAGGNRRRAGNFSRERLGRNFRKLDVRARGHVR